MFAVLATISGNTEAQEVVLDFSNAAEDWGITATSKNKETGTVSYTNGDYTIILSGDGSNGFAAYKGYVLFGKNGASLTLPAFDFPVEVIEFVGNKGASESVKMNVFVGDEAISESTKGSTGVNLYYIREAYQSGNQFKLKVTNSYNAQVTKIKIYKVGCPDSPTQREPVTLVGDGTADNPYTVADAMQLYTESKAPKEAVWVKGIIAGNIDTDHGNKLKVPATPDEAITTNLAITEDDNMLSVQLPSNTVARSGLNLQDHITYIGKEVAVHGVITAYCSMAGVKSVDNYMIDGEMEVGQVPSAPNFGDFTSTIDPATPYDVRLEVVLPNIDNEGLPLTEPITKVEFGEYQGITGNAVLYVEDDSAKLVTGQKIECNMSNVANGMHTYYVLIYTKYGCSRMETCDTYVGIDTPNPVSNIMTEIIEDKVMISWDAPIGGEHGCDIGDINDLAYTIRRVRDEYDDKSVVIAEGIKELSFIDDTVYDEENKHLYLIQAKNVIGAGQDAVSDYVVVGPPARLPYTENFDAMYEENGSVRTQHSAWDMDGEDDIISWEIMTYYDEVVDAVIPHSGRGYARIVYFGDEERHHWDHLTTGNIDFTDGDASHQSVPQLTFWLYDFAKGCTDVKLSIQTTTDGTQYTTASTISIGDAAVTGWRQVCVPLDAVAGAKKTKIRFKAEVDGSNYTEFYIDDVVISTGETSGIINIDNHAMPNHVYNLNGQQVRKNMRGIIIEDGKKRLNR